MKTIYIVEDHDVIRNGVLQYMSLSGFDARGFATIGDAREAFSKAVPDLLVQDVMLPDGDGFSFVKEMKEKHPSLPVIFLTARVDESDRILGFELGADDYITKPFRPLEMIARVKSQLRRYQKYNPAHSDTGETSSAASEDNLVCGSLTMNIKAHTCFLGETPLVLTPTEFSILRILLENTGNVVSSEDLFHKIWQDEYYSKSNNTITVHIRHLREKLGDSMDKPRFIKTIWGVGYKIES